MKTTEPEPFTFSAEDCQALEQVRQGMGERSKPIGSLEQVETYILAVERLVTAHRFWHSAPALASVPIAEIRKLQMRTNTLQRALHGATDGTRYWIADEMRNRLQGTDLETWAILQEYVWIRCRETR